MRKKVWKIYLWHFFLLSSLLSLLLLLSTLYSLPSSPLSSLGVENSPVALTEVKICTIQCFGIFAIIFCQIPDTAYNNIILLLTRKGLPYNKNTKYHTFTLSLLLHFHTFTLFFAHAHLGCLRGSIITAAPGITSKLKLS
jgi:hypothetical protein